MTTPESPNPSGWLAIDGATEIVDINKTEANKILAQQFVENVLIGKNAGDRGAYFDDDWLIQHDPQIDGADAYLTGLLQNGLEYAHVEKVLGQGNFVLVMSSGSDNGTPAAFYDLYRINNGKITEHWDVIEAIPPKSEWKNPNGKLGFS